MELCGHFAGCSDYTFRVQLHAKSSSTHAIAMVSDSTKHFNVILPLISRRRVLVYPNSINHSLESNKRAIMAFEKALIMRTLKSLCFVHLIKIVHSHLFLACGNDRAAKPKWPFISRVPVISGCKMVSTKMMQKLQISLLIYFIFLLRLDRGSHHHPIPALTPNPFSGNI